MTRTLNRWSYACLLSLVLLGAATARAQDAKRVVVLEFDGAGAAPVRGHVVKALQARPEVEVLPSREVESAASRLGASLDNEADLGRVAEDLRISAFIDGKVGKDGKNVRAVVRVRNAATGEIVHEEPWTRKTKAQLKAIRESFWSIMGAHILATEPPAAKPSEPEPAPVVEEPVAEAPTAIEEPEREPTTAASYTHPALILYLGPRLMWRTLSYEGNTGFSGYENQPGSPAFNVALGAQWFPGAHTRDDWLSDFGLELDADYAIGLKSKQNGKELSTTAYELGVGAVYRIPIDAFEPRIRLGYVQHTFDASTPALPAVTYSSVRAGAGTIVNVVDWLALDVSLAFLYVLDTGELGSSKYASDVSAKAFEAGGGITTRFNGVCGVRLAVDFRRYVYDFGATKSAALPLPSGGTDDYLRATLAFVLTLPGAGSATGQ